MWNRQNDEPKHPDLSQRPPGVIDTIGLGYETLFTRPLLIVPPVLLDVYLWFGVHISSQPLTMRLASWLRQQSVVPDGAASRVEQSGTHNITSLSAFWTPTVRVPSFLATVPDETAYRIENWRPVLNLSTWGIVAVGLLFLVAGLVIGAEYLLAIASATALPGRTQNRTPGSGVFRGAGKLAGWYATVVLLGLLILWPLLAGYGAAEYFGTGSSFWLILMVLLPVSWAFVFFFFSVQAMFMDNCGPLAGLRSSYRVVRSDGWNSLGIIFAYFLLTVGFPQVWLLIVAQPIGLLVAIVGHAVIGTGMIAATMVFYRDRVQRLNVAGRV